MLEVSKYIYKSHYVTVLLYHFVSIVKYQRVVITGSVDQVLVKVCKGIEAYEVNFLEIGTDNDHFLIQSVPCYSVIKIVTIEKSIVAREVFKHCPEVKKQL